jgi:ABC-type transport system involved in cytochrome c biogenesis permease subunit
MQDYARIAIEMRLSQPEKILFIKSLNKNFPFLGFNYKLTTGNAVLSLIGRFSSRSNIYRSLFIACWILLSYFFFSETGTTLVDDLRLFLSFLALIAIFVSYTADIGPVEYSIVLLILGAIGLAAGNEKIANHLAVYSYLLLIVGIIKYFIDSLKRRSRMRKKDITTNKKY